MEAISGRLTRSTPKAAGIFSFGFLDPQRVAWRKRGAEIGAWAERASLRFERDPVPAQALAGCQGLRTTDAVPVREAWHRVSGARDGLAFTVFDLRSKCRALAGSRAPVDRLETFAAFPLPGAVVPELSLWVFSTARPGTPEAAAVAVARRWAGGASGGSDGGGNDFVVDSCVGTWKPGDAGQSREVLLDSHPGLFLTGADPSAVRRLFGTAVAEFFSDKRGWRVEAGAGALLVSCDVERLPAGWSADPLAGPIACDHLDEFLARATAIARLIRDEAAATVP